MSRGALDNIRAIPYKVTIDYVISNVFPTKVGKPYFISRTNICTLYDIIVLILPIILFEEPIC